MKYLKRSAIVIFAVIFLWGATRLFVLEVAFANLRGTLVVEVSRVVEGKILLPEENIRLNSFYKDNLILLSCGVPYYVSTFIETDMLDQLRQGANVAWGGVSSVESGDFMCEGRVREYLLHRVRVPQ